MTDTTTPDSEAADVETPEPATGPAQTDELGDAGQKALASERAARRDAEKQSRALQKQLEALERQTMSDTEKAVAEARDAGRAEAVQQLGTRIVDAELRAAATGRTFATDALLSLDRSQFLSDTGDVDIDAIRAWVDEHGAAPEQPEPAAEPAGPLGGMQIDLGQGQQEPMALNGDPLLETLKRAVGAQ